jgi:hypothetical protein
MSRTKVRFFHLYGNAQGLDGKNHVITVVGKLEQGTEKKEFNDSIPVEIRPGSYVNGELKYTRKAFKRKLTIGASICHPMDDFDEEKGIEVAKARIAAGDNLGVLETNSVTMLTDDAILAELFVKLNYMTENIDDYLPEE